VLPDHIKVDKKHCEIYNFYLMVYIKYYATLSDQEK